MSCTCMHFTQACPPMSCIPLVILISGYYCCLCTGKVVLACDVTSSQSSVFPASHQCHTGQHCNYCGMHGTVKQPLSTHAALQIHIHAPTHPHTHTHNMYIPTHLPIQFVLKYILKAPPHLYSQWLDLRKLPQVTTELPQQVYLFGMPV